MGNKRLRGFTLVELMVTVSVMSIMAAVIALNVDFTRQSAKHEAEKVATYIENLMKKSNRIHTSFDIEVKDKVIKVSWGIHDVHVESLDATIGCTYTPSAEIMIYDRNNFTNRDRVTVDTDEKDSSDDEYDYHIKITDSAGEEYYVGIRKQ